jgi:ribosomal protein L29
LDNEILTEIKVSIAEIKTILNERNFSFREGIQQNAKNIGLAFSNIKELEHGLIKNNEETHRIGIDQDKIHAEIEDLKKAVNNLKLSIAKISFIATLASSGITAIVIKFFLG